MTDLERLKRVIEAEPMAVLVKKMPKNCMECDGWVNGFGGNYCTYTEGIGRLGDMYIRHEDCPFHKAIGIIEPGGFIRYLTEEDKA